MYVQINLCFHIAPGRPSLPAFHSTTFCFTMLLLRVCVQVKLCFNSAPGIPLPPWVLDVGRANPGIFYTDKSASHSKECLSLGVDDCE
jgi:beta-amylase